MCSNQESISVLATAKEKEAHDAKVKEGRKQAGNILGQLATLIDMIDPTVKLQRKVTKNKSSLVRDLTGLTSASAHYQTCIEQVCDDLLENADKKID